MPGPDVEAPLMWSWDRAFDCLEMNESTGIYWSTELWSEIRLNGNGVCYSKTKVFTSKVNLTPFRSILP